MAYGEWLPRFVVCGTLLVRASWVRNPGRIPRNILFGKAPKTE